MKTGKTALQKWGIKNEGKFRTGNIENKMSGH